MQTIVRLISKREKLISQDGQKAGVTKNPYAWFIG